MRKLLRAPAFWTAIVGALLIAAMVVSMRRSSWPFPDAHPPAMETDAVILAANENGAALRYARAVREGNCDEVIAMTLWMRERIEHVQLQQPDRVTDIREDLCSTLTDRRIEGNRLGAEGMEDQYVLPPGCAIELVGVDAGRDDLERPSAARAWVKVTYPRAERAPLDLQGRPIRSVIAGINTTEDAYVMKAAVVGNLEIDLDSVDTQWNAN